MLVSNLRNCYVNRKTFCLVLALAICLFYLSFAPSASAATPTLQKNGVEFIYESSNPTNSLYSYSTTSSLVWGVDGGRESRPSTAEERVWGWSTCKDSAGTDVRHYTIAQYETIGGQARASSGRIWGIGKVWAYSGWVSYDNAIALKARVYNGI